MATKPIGINFHEGLQLTRSRLSTALRFFQDHPNSSRDDLFKGTELGVNMAIAFPNLAEACGFLEDTKPGKGKSLTRLGETVIQHDPHLEDQASLWLIHFGMVDPKGRGPLFWKSSFLETLRTGSSVPIGELSDQVQKQESVLPSKVQLAIGKFTDGYTNPGFLGDLGLVKKEGVGFIAATPASSPSVGVFAYALVRRWEALHPGALTTGLDSFLNESRLLDTFRISRESAVDLLEQLSRRGDIELYRSAPPHQIVRRWEDPDEVLRRIYNDA